MARGTIHDLFSDVLEKLGRFVHFDRLVLLLSDEAAGTITLSEVCSTLPHNAPVGLVYRMEESPAGEAIRTQQRVYIADVETDRRFPYVMELLRQEQLRVFCYLPLTSPARRIGALGFGTRAAIQYSEEDLGLIERAMQPVAIAVENILNRHSVERERDRLKLLLEVNNALVTRLDPQDLFEHISGLLEDSVPHEYLAVSLWDPESGHLRLKFVVNPRTEDYRDLPLPPGTPSGDAFDAGVARVYDARYISNLSGPVGEMLRSERIRSICAIPLQTVRGKIGVITVGSRQERAYRPSVMERLEMLCGQLAIAVDNAMAYAKMEELNRRLREAKMYLEEEIQTASASDEILGVSSGIRRVLQEIETVASTDATVLIQGETGSGKELVARALHQKSPRAKGTFVKLNCAAIPTGLLESELFGHERGAFTGAIAQKIGRFEIAHQGTLFLDEIGEIPLDLQPKLLRVLQEKEFERLGSTRTIRTDARLVAATNRDLKQMAEAGQFRSDLYYRLNVFPIRVPPLRERRDDIPGLVMHFTQQYARRFGKKIVAIPTEVVSELVAYHWPGNIRELQNLIERSVILTQGDTLRIPVHELDAVPEQPVRLASNSAQPQEAPSTMQEIERQAILGALRDARGVVGGTKGAAAKLGMKRTSLLYRMEKLGIKKPE